VINFKPYVQTRHISFRKQIICLIKSIKKILLANEMDMKWMWLEIIIHSWVLSNSIFFVSREWWLIRKILIFRVSKSKWVRSWRRKDWIIKRKPKKKNISISVMRKSSILAFILFFAFIGHIFLILRICLKVMGAWNF